MHRFKNQYILTKDGVEEQLKLNWPKLQLQGYSVQYSPDLSVYECQRENGLKLILIGFAFHAQNAALNEIEILDLLCDENSFLDQLDYLCGHYIIIRQHNGIQVYTDTAATLKAFYYHYHDEVIAMASDTKLLSEAMGLSMSKAIEVQEFFNGESFKSNLIRLGNLTAYDNVLQLIPNHLLNIQDASIERYFPRETKWDKPLDEAIVEVNTYVTNIVDAAYGKFNVHCSLTAGWDSRMLVAFSKRHNDKTEFYTFKQAWFKDNHIDLMTPKKIANSLHLKHRIITKTNTLPQQDVDQLLDSFDFLDNDHGDKILGGYTHYAKPQDMILVGLVSEVCKNYYDDVIINDGKSLAQASHFPTSDYCLRFFQKKYEELTEITGRFNYDIRDIAHWEQDITNFAGQRIAYVSSVTNVLAPFNCRAILKTILAVPRNLRDKQQHEFYRQYLNKYYPELNAFPINPTLKRTLIVLSKKLGIYKPYKIISTSLKG